MSDIRFVHLVCRLKKSPKDDEPVVLEYGREFVHLRSAEEYIEEKSKETYHDYVILKVYRRS